MYDDIREILSCYRAPQRVDIFVGLSEHLANTDYGDNLQITTEHIMSLDLTAELRALDLEKEICIMTTALCTRLGFNTTPALVDQNPSQILDILSVVLEELDYFDDYETPIKIIETESTPFMQLVCLVAFIKGNNEYKYMECLDSVLPTSMDKIRKVLEGRERDATPTTTNTDVVLARHAGHFIEKYANAHNISQFKNFGYLRPVPVIMSNCIFRKSEFEDDVVTTIAGILFTKHHTYSEAYDVIEWTLASVAGDNELLTYSRLISDMLAELYKEVSGEEV